MTNSPTSNSEHRSASFELLDVRIQRWIWEHRWTELRDAQEKAIPPILEGKRDVIIAAATAAGKTEAAFLPILTRLAQRGGRPGLAMYVSPLKALINDQWLRLEDLAGALEIPVTPWHGDISAGVKQRFFRDPVGCLLITPESVESTLVRHGSSLPAVFGNLRYIVIDELHSFLGSERGKQMQSQLCRIEQGLGRRIPRVGLSATLGDMEGAKRFLRAEDPSNVTLVGSGSGGQDLQVVVKGFVEPAATDDETDATELAIAAHLFQVLRGTNNLVFPNSRRAVEFYSDRLRQLCEETKVPNEFWPHHGSLSREIREETEAALKQRERPATAICTNTLELGIDIGAVKSVAQIGPPPTVASLRQRLGRSGRRAGEPAVFRAYSIEPELVADAPLYVRLREGLVQSAAMVRLLVRGWYEPVDVDGLHVSTLVQQVLSLIAQFGGSTAKQIWNLLCENGAFHAITRDALGSLLRHLGTEEVIFQDPTGLILLAPKGERIVGHHSFYATFQSDEEYQVTASGRVLGSMAINSPLVVGGFIIFAGRRWEVVSVSEEERVIEVKSAAAGTLPAFGGGTRAHVHGVVRSEMREILRAAETVPFLDKPAQALLQQAREQYRLLALDTCAIRQAGCQTQVLTWSGDRVNDTLALMLHGRNLQTENAGLYLEVRAPKETVIAALESVVAAPNISSAELMASVANTTQHKWDHLVPPALLASSFAAERLDVPGALMTARAVLSQT